MKKNHITTWLLGEREKMTGMTAREKLSYIWDYYRLWIIVIVSLTAALTWGIHHYVTTKAENWFFACFINTQKDLGDGSELWKGFAEYAGYDLGEKNLHFDARLYFDPEKKAYQNQYYDLMIAYLESGQLDVMVMTPEQVAAFGATGRLMDLEDPRVSALMERYSDRIIWCEPDDESFGKDRVAVGIDVTGSVLTTEDGPYPGGAAVGISAHSGHTDQVPVFLDYLLQTSG